MEEEDIQPPLRRNLPQVLLQPSTATAISATKLIPVYIHSFIHTYIQMLTNELKLINLFSPLYLLIVYGIHRNVFM